MEGWIKLHRKIADNDLWVTNNHLAKIMFIDCLLRANHKTRLVPIRGSFCVEVKRGEFITSLRKLAVKYETTTKTIKRNLVLLEKLRIIKAEGKTLYTVVKVLNYDQYQSKSDNVVNSDDYSEETVVTTQSKQTRPTNKNVKNVKNERMKETTNIYTSDFNSFYDQYPKKIGKKPAFTIWQRKHLKEKTDVIVEFVKKASLTKQWLDGYVPNPTTFLNQERWEDDLSSYGGKQREVVSVR